MSSPFPMRDKKLEALFEKYGHDITREKFIEVFQVEYPNDWSRINKVSKEHEERQRSGKRKIMPNPYQYLKNLYNVYMKKRS